MVSEDSAFIANQSLFPGFANCSCKPRSGGFACGGSGDYLNDSTLHAVLYRCDAQGKFLWYRQYGSINEVWIGRQGVCVRDKGFVIAGETGLVDGFLIKTDSSGNEQWTRTYGSPTLWDTFIGADTTEDGGYFTCGLSYDANFSTNMWVQRLDSAGDVIWQKNWGSIYKDVDPHVTTCVDGNAVLGCTWSYAENFGSTRPYMAKLNKDDGSFIWQHQYGPLAFNAGLFYPKECADGGFIAAGLTYLTNYEQGLLLRTNSDGDSLWMRTYLYSDSLMTDGTGGFRDVVPTDDGGFAAVGTVFNSASGNDPPNYTQDVWVVKVDSFGCIVPGCQLLDGVTENITNMSDALSVFPNPVHDQLHVRIKLPANFKIEGPLTLSVISLEGRIIKQQVVPTSGSFPTGEGRDGADELVIDVSGLSAGAYTVHLSDAHTWITGNKFIIE